MQLARAMPAACIMLLPTVALAEKHEIPRDIPMFVMEVVPMTINAADRHGLVGDIVEEALRRANLVTHVMFVPAKRALTLAPGATDTLIMPLARLKERETRYTWIAPIVEVQRAFYGLHRQVDSFEAAKTQFKSIGVERGTAGLDILLDEGFSRDQIVEVSDGITPLRMLLAGRLDAWYSPVSEALSLLKLIDDGHAVEGGAPVGGTFNYVACSKICNPLIVSKLSASLNAMFADGAVQSIAGRYGDISGVRIVPPLVPGQ
jgi:polar amino acid transport system substrate-binding protein